MSNPKKNAGDSNNPAARKRQKKTTAAAPTNDQARQGAKDRFPIVGIGASAGGLEALEQFFRHMPADSGMAFVVIVHLSPDHKSMMSDILQKHTAMPVREIEDSMVVAPNSVYIIVPNTDVGILNGTLQLLDPDQPRGRRAPIDYFFRSLADDQAERAIAIILSGTGSNGSLGLQAIKAAGGMVMVQNPETAKYDGMPTRAIGTGLTDYVLAPAQMPDSLLEYVTDFKVKLNRPPLFHTPQNQAALQKAFILLRDQTGHDFSGYKQSTIERRLNRRMAVHQIETLPDYVRYLGQEPAEVKTLFREFLIGVTNFFRDPEAFEVLKQKVLPHLFQNKPASQPLRVWVAGCSTGEEAYSIAIVVKEYMSEHDLNHKVQIFASDIDPEAVTQARPGIYPDGIVVDVSPQRLSHFFTLEDSSYRINGDIREMVIFAEQSVIKDAPFSRLDLISCRNLLIYLQAEMQHNILDLFHYSLKQEGMLFLGTSETRVEANDHQFVAFDSKWKFFKRVGDTPGHHPMANFSFREIEPFSLPAGPDKRGARRPGPEAVPTPRLLAERMLLADYAPPAAIVDEEGLVIYIHGQTEPYLLPPSGEQPFSLIEMAREGLRLQLRTGIHKATQQHETVVYERLRITLKDEERHLKLTIRPLAAEHDGKSGWAMVIFETAPEPPQLKIAPSDQPSTSGDRLRLAELEQELTATKDFLQTTVEELETANEDVRAANEELQAANEELQSMNEELQTSQEELRSSNEELMTMNSEYENKIESLREGHDDVKNLLFNSQVAILFVDMELRIKHFTPLVGEVVRLIPSDVGRPLPDLTIKLNYDHLVEDAHQVLKTLTPKEVEAQSEDGRWFSARLLPYRTVDNIIAGVVITFTEITTLKTVLRQQHLLDYLSAIVATVREPLLVLTSELRIVSANRAFYRTFQVAPQQTEGQLIYKVGNNQWDIPRLRQLLEEIITRDNSFEDFEVKHDFPAIGRRVMRLNARRLRQKDDEPELILLAIEDVTEGE